MLETLVSVEEYLHSSYEHDVDYVDGRIEERGMPTREHRDCQFRVCLLLQQRGLKAYIETRVQTSETRYLVPDICAYAKKPAESIFTNAPLLCVQVLSPDDQMSRVMDVVGDFLAMGVPVVWILDPVRKRAYTADATGLLPAAIELRTVDGDIALSLDEIFADDDQDLDRRA
jgi:Uma2 family endonuclease